jgi:hypothetical protein
MTVFGCEDHASVSWKYCPTTASTGAPSGVAVEFPSLSRDGARLSGTLNGRGRDGAMMSRGLDQSTKHKIRLLAFYAFSVAKAPSRKQIEDQAGEK